MNKNVIVDADAIIAIVDSSDVHHKKAVIIRDILSSKNFNFLYPTTTIAESVTAIQRGKNNKALAKKMLPFFLTSSYSNIDVSTHLLTTANEYFNEDKSKKDTLFDCIVAACAKEYGAEYIFSFDKFYKKLGYKIADDILNLK